MAVHHPELAGPLVFVDVDTQRDFLEPTGALSIAGAEEIAANLARLTTFARSEGIPILATACAHTLDEEDPEPFPPHCLIGTGGHERVEATAWADSLVLRPDQRLIDHGIDHESDDPPPHLTLQKQRYDLFSHPDSERVLALYARTRPTFVVYGVATDYCVKAAVLGLLDNRHPVVLVADAIRAVDPASEAEELTEMVRRGATLALTDVVCRPRTPVS